MISGHKTPLYLSVLILLAFLGASFSSAQKAPSSSHAYAVYTIYIPGLITEDLSGNFVALNQEINKRANVQLNLVIVPPKRQRTSFNQKKYDIIFPMVASSFAKDTDYRRSSAFYEKRYFAFTAKGVPLVSSLTDLENVQGTIGLTRGYSYPDSLLSNSKLTFELAAADDHNMLKLKTGKIDAFVVEEISGLQAMKNTNLEQSIRYDPAAPLFIEEVFYAFQPEPRLNAVREAISKAIDEMKIDGSLEKILKAKPP